jgi:hypothetical protein
VIAHTERNIRTVVGHLKSEATRKLRECGFFPDYTPWADHGWNVFLDSVEDVERAIAYVQNNPIRGGKRQQRWQCVTPFNPATARGAII